MRPHQLAASVIALFLLAPSAARAADDYKLGPDSERHEGVPTGTLTQHKWENSKIFPGTVRDYWVYIPAQYDKAKPAAVMIFQDGGSFVAEKGSYRAPTVLDNLIHKKEMPVTIGLFINPGVIPVAEGADKDRAHPRFNRSFEYDGMSDAYARFLLDEILPEVGKSYNLAKDPNARGLCGSSSGGICAFTAAWQRPDEFRRVVSFVGSFANLRGGNEFAALIRKSEPRPMRIYMQDGANDLDIFAGSWWVANQDIASALNFAGYEFHFEKGDGAHNGKHAGAVLPDALRYIWKDYPAAPAKGTFPLATKDTRPTVMDILLPGEEWQMLSEGHKFTEGPAADADGNVYFTDIPNNRIHKIDKDGKVSVFAENTGGANGLALGPDGRLYSAQGGKKRVAAYDVKDAKETIIAEDIECNDLVVTHKGGIYVTEPPKKQVWHIDAKGEKKVVDKGIEQPNGITLTPDQTQLIVADTRTPNLYIFQIKPDGSLANKQAYFTCEMPSGIGESGADGIKTDTQGRLYVTTRMGVQIFDEAGRVIAIISKPQNQWLANVCFGGPDGQYIYATCGDKVFRRKTKAKGVMYYVAPVLPPTPRL